MAGSSLKSNKTSVVNNHLTKYRGFQKNTNFEIDVSFSDSVKMKYRVLNSLIDSTFKALVNRQTFNKIRANASKMATKAEQASSADTKDTTSP